MRDSQDYYQILQVAKTASQSDIKLAFRRLARQYHPDLNPNNPSAAAVFKQVCDAYQILGDPELRSHYDLESLDPEAPAPTATAFHQLYVQGVEKASRQKYHQAIADLTQALQLNPQFLEAYLQRCQARYMIGDDRGVLEDCHQALQLDPHATQAHFYQGRARHRLGYVEAALDAYTQAIASDPEFAPAYYHRGLAQRELQTPTAAQRDLQTAADLFQAQHHWQGHHRAQEALRSRQTQTLVLPKFITLLGAMPLVLMTTAGQFLLNPGALLTALGRLQPAQAVWVSLGWGAIASLSLSLTLDLQLQSPVSWLALFLGGWLPFGSLVIVGAIARRLSRAQGNWLGDLFIAGAALLPMSLWSLLSLLLPWVGGAIILTLGLFAGCYTVLLLYIGCTQIHNFSERSAALTVPLQLAVSFWLTYFVFRQWF